MTNDDRRFSDLPALSREREREGAIEVGDEEEIERDTTSRHRDGRVSHGCVGKLKSPTRFENIISCAKK